MGFRSLLHFLVLAIGVSSCTCAPAPEPERARAEAARAAAPGLRGRVVVAVQKPDGTFPPVDVWVAPGAAMAEHAAIRLGAARKALAELAGARERARKETEAALAETDRTDQAWKATTENDLYRRVEVLLRRPSDPRDVAAVHGDLLARKKAVYKRAVKAARRSAEKEQALEVLERDARRYLDASFFALGLPSVVRATRTDGSGNFGMDLAPGRYVLVAVTDASSDKAAAEEGWLLWVEVREGAPEPILLDQRNRHGTDCGACVVAVRDLQ